MSGNLHHQPQQQAGKAQRLRTQLSRPTLGLRHDFGMQPHPDIAQHQRHAHKQQTQGRFAAAGAHTSLMRLAIGRLNAKTTAVGGANPTPGPMRDAPGGIQQGLSLVTSPVAPGVVTDHRQVKIDVALFRALQGIGGPVALFRGRQRIGAGGSPRRGGLFPAFDRGHDEGQLTSDQVLDDPYTVKAAIEQQELHADTQA